MVGRRRRRRGPPRRRPGALPLYCPFYCIMACNIDILKYAFNFIILLHVISIKYALHCTSCCIVDGANLGAVAPVPPYYIRYLNSSANHIIYIYI